MSQSWRPIRRLADRYISRFSKTFESSVKRIRSKVTEELVVADLERGLTDEPVNLYGLLDELTVAKAQSSEHDLYAEILTNSATLTLGNEFRIQSPFVQEAARTLTANLVQGINAESRSAIRQVIFESIRNGDPPAVAQQKIRQIVGLTRRDAVAVSKIYDSMHSAASTARQRMLADRRVESYSKKLLRHRALNIARTETMRSANRGQQLAWQQMMSDNLIDTSRFQQRWLVTPDDRLCELCAPMDEMLVPLDGSFESTERGVLPSERESYAGETVDSPPLHPSCRCVLVGDFGDAR